MSEFASWIGTICSLIGAAISFFQAQNARKYANEAESVKGQLINHRKTSELSELQFLLSSAQKTFLKYGASKPSALAGIDHIEDAKVALEFTVRLKAMREYFIDLYINAADQTYDEINNSLAEFKKAKSSTKVSEFGNKILISITSFSPHLQRELTTQKESTIK